jgi:hypothetical protein
MIQSYTPVFLGSGRCFHTLDWFRSCCELNNGQPVFVTDNYGAEGFIPLLKTTDNVLELIVIDALLFKHSSTFGHRWRNFVKLMAIPFQIFKLRKILKKIDNPFVFAHSTYYAFLASFCNVRYAAFPQGSEVLVRPNKSQFYKLFLIRSIKYSTFVVVDSVAMASGLRRIANINPYIIQNGIAISEIKYDSRGEKRDLVVSIRGFARNYRIVDILKARNLTAPNIVLNFCCPFVEETYRQEIQGLVDASDVIHGRLDRKQMYEMFKKASCVISIPSSDSSPRSVYEAIFCGAAVICTHASYIDTLPACMRQRIVLVNLSDSAWFSNALALALEISAEPFVPSPEALELFDQMSSMRKCMEFAATAQNVEK